MHSMLSPVGCIQYLTLSFEEEHASRHVHFACILAGRQAGTFIALCGPKGQMTNRCRWKRVVLAAPTNGLPVAVTRFRA